MNLLQGTGYWLFSGLGNVGDWVEVVKGLSPAGAWRGGLVALGLAGYMASIYMGLRTLHTLLGRGASLEQDGRLLTLPAYVAGGAMYVVAGLFNPISPQLVLISAAAASFGGTSALAWMASMYGDTRRFPEPQTAPIKIPRSRAWMAAGGLVFLVFVGVFGRTVSLR